jgi:hypothetical protein
MKSLSRSSVWVVFAALLCFASSAFCQSKINVKVANSGNSVLNSAPAGFLAFTFGPGGNHIIGGNRGGNNGGNNGGNQGGNGGSQNGCGNQGWNDRVGGGRCTQVPEGGTALMYLLLAGLCCAAAMVLRPQQAEVRQTN